MYRSQARWQGFRRSARAKLTMLALSVSTVGVSGRQGGHGQRRFCNIGVSQSVNASRRSGGAWLKAGEVPGVAGSAIPATSSAGSFPEASEGKYAVLHDFCMAIPYGAIIVVTGIIVGFMGPTAAGVLLATSGLGVLACAGISLKRWKLGKATTMSTGVIALIAAYHAWLWGMKFKIMMVKGKALECMFSAPFGLFLLSSLMAIFAMYNITAGGNPPKKEKTA